jgi:glucose-6-phosphate isomerase
MHALLVGAQRAYQQAACPFTHCIMECKDAYTVGQFMQWKMIETIYLGFLLGVNPFDQPQVELYKQETRKIVRDA